MTATFGREWCGSHPCRRVRWGHRFQPSALAIGGGFASSSGQRNR